MPNLAVLSVPGLLAMLLVIESGIPLPVPGDLLMLLVGERAAAGAVPLWVAFMGLEAAAIAGTSILFFAVRGPASRLLPRFGPRVGLTPERLGRASELVERRGSWALLLGRMTPGLRTLTVVAAAGSTIAPARALAFLCTGASIFIQAHLVAGYVVGPVAERAFARNAPLAAAVLVTLAVAVTGLSALQRHRRAGTHAWLHSTCPACIAGSAVARRVGLEPISAAR
jgi:membrane protein DedA with SNARE-associated domain